MPSISAPPTPDIGDPVVTDGHKHRIRELDAGGATLAMAGPHWRTAPIRGRVPLEALTWDPRAHVYRVPDPMFSAGELAGETPAAAIADPELEQRPGYCSDHPGQELVTAARDPRVRRYTTERVICLECPVEASGRCRWCGGELYPPDDDGRRTPYWRQSATRAYCSPADRLRAFRAGKRAAVAS